MSSLTLYGRMLRYLRPYIPVLMSSVFLSTIIVALEGVSLWLSAPLVKTLFMPEAAAPEKPAVTIQNAYGVLKYYTYTWLQRSDPLSALKTVCILMVLAFLLKNVLFYIKQLIVSSINLHVERDFRDDLYRHALTLPVTYYDRNRSGNIMSLIVRDVSTINSSMTGTLDKLVLEPLRVIVFIVMLFAISTRLSLTVLLAFPLLAVFTTVIGKVVRRRSRKTLESFSGIVALLHEIIAGIRTVKLFGMESAEERRFRTESRSFVKRSFRSAAIGHLGGPVIETLGIAVAAALLWFGGREVLSGRSVSPEDFMLFLIYVFSCFKPLKTLSGVQNTLQSGFAAAERVFNLLSTPAEPVEMKSTAKPLAFTDKISFEHVSFSYPSCDEVVLTDITFELKKGQVVALVGPSGSGKSTVLDLLPRFYETSTGRILLDGVPIRDLDLSSLRNLFGTVAQETILFNDTVAANIAYGLVGATDEQIEAAARAANAWEFIERLPHKLQTTIGERGALLSGGQRQRLAIARALLRNPPVLILDEATSALDTESERLVQEAINTLMQNRTALVVAHRLSTIRNADQIIVLDNGRITERGSHEHLYAAGGRYRRLHDIQFGAA